MVYEFEHFRGSLELKQKIKVRGIKYEFYILVKPGGNLRSVTKMNFMKIGGSLVETCMQLMWGCLKCVNKF